MARKKADPVPDLIPREVIEDFKRSGLDIGDARIMKISFVPPDEVAELTKGSKRAAYKIPYFNSKGDAAPFFRLRFVGAASLLDENADLRYWQPPRTHPHIYLPPHIDWKAVARNPKTPVYIVEGEKKAAAGCKILDRPVIGLGGVWSWGSKKNATTMLPDLKPFVEDGRTVIIVFDTDPVQNTQVEAAREALAQAVWQHGGVAKFVTLPLLARGQKVGLDDFLIARGAAGFDDLEVSGSEYIDALTALNSELAFIDQYCSIYHFATRKFFPMPAHFAATMYGTRFVTRYLRDGTPVERSTLLEWMRWPGRRAHTDFTYAPGQPDVIDGNVYNAWPGWPYEPKRGSLKLFTTLINQLFAGDDAARDWFLRWLAYPIQNPGVKMYTATVMMSRDHGTGKSLIGYTMERVYGENFGMITAEDLHSKFNSWLRNKQFMMGEELVGSEKRADAERLKALVTSERIMVNNKFEPVITLNHCTNYYLTTNHADALALDPKDRRFFVHEIMSDKLPDEFFREYDTWYRSDEAAQALMHYFSTLPLGDFNPRAAAPRTNAKSHMTMLTGTNVDYVIREFLADPDGYVTALAPGAKTGRDLYTAREIRALLDPDGRDRFTDISVGKALRRLGAVQLGDTGTARGTKGLFAIRNQAQWLRASPRQRADHYDAY